MQLFKSVILFRILIYELTYCTGAARGNLETNESENSYTNENAMCTYTNKEEQKQRIQFF